MPTILDQLRFGKAFLKLIKDPGKTENIFRFVDIGLKYPDDPAALDVVNFAMANEEVRKMYEEKYSPPPADLKQLGSLSDGTLGKEYSNHMTKNGFNTDFGLEIKVKNELDYVSVRITSTHDIWHALTGYDTSVKGELALQGFALSQTRSGISAAILSGGILHIMDHHCIDIIELMDIIWEGYERGKRAKFLLGVRWEENWGTSLNEIKEEYNIE